MPEVLVMLLPWLILGGILVLGVAIAAFLASLRRQLHRMAENIEQIASILQNPSRPGGPGRSRPGDRI